MLNDNLDSLFSGELGGGTGSDAGERGGGARPAAASATAAGGSVGTNMGR